MTEIILYNLQPLFFSLVHMRGRWKCGSGNIGTVQNAGWKMREWKHREVNEYGKLGLTYCLTQHDTNQKCINNIPYSMQTHRNERNFSKSKNFRKYDFLGGLEFRGVWKVAFVSAKGTSLRASTSFEPFSVKIGWGLQSRDRENVRKSCEAPIGKTCHR